MEVGSFYFRPDKVGRQFNLGISLALTDKRVLSTGAFFNFLCVANIEFHSVM